jgi:molybdate transport system substrate-binding protein
MKRRLFLALSTLAFITPGIGCSPSAPTPTPSAIAPPNEAAVQLTISVAASVKDAMADIQTAYEAENPTVQVTYNFGSSGSLAQQILQGAPTDIFLSASQKWMDELEDRNQIVENSRHNLLRNSLVLVVLQDRTDITGFSDLANDTISRVAIGEPESVPAGQYAKEALITLNLFDSLQSRLTFGKDVWQVLSYVETGNVDAGLIYATDAKVSDRVKVVAIASPNTHSPITYPISIVADSEQIEAAQSFIEFLSSDRAIEIFDSYGFTVESE